MENIGEKIYNLRKRKNVSQEGLAFELGVARQTVSKWEMDATQPTLENVAEMCEFFGVNAAYFFDKGEVAASDTAQAEQADKPEAGKEKYKKLKIVLMVVGAVSIILCLIFGGMALYDFVAPTEDEFNFYFPAITCLIVGIIAAAILITLMILIVYKHKKKKLLISSDKLQ